MIKSHQLKHKKSGRPIKDPSCSFPTVGIGASAGGLETFTQLLRSLPCDTGMAFVLIQHLDPNHESFLTEALTKTTRMPIHEIEDGMTIKPNHVYVIPPATDVGVLRGHFKLFSRDKKTRRPYMAVDFFFRALAAECRSQAIGVVLSGTASDGTEGLRAIKAENGVTFVQDPNSAKFSGMPQSAVNAEVADFCLPVSQLVTELVRLARHPYLAKRIQEPLSSQKDIKELEKSFVLLRTSTGIDFSEYKPATIKRRLARRMALCKINGLKEYVAYLQSNPEEIKALTQDVLIHVTSFFRDPEVFKKLKTSVFPNIIKKKATDAPIRVWIAGCSSGEEVYSIAISLLEFLEQTKRKFPIQIFGSDISERLIEKARTALYTESAIQNVGPERLRRFFIKVEGGYRINKLVRDLCIFVRHDLSRDPPFSKLDLVTCRNVLIYFELALQKRIISTFHYCLNQPGFLLLGRSENILGYHHFFSMKDKTSKIFAREPVTSQLRFKPSHSTRVYPLPLAPPRPGSPGFAVDIAKHTDNLLISEYARASVVVNEKLEILQFRGETSLYLIQPPGSPQFNLLRMVRKELYTPLKILLQRAKKKVITVRHEGLKFKQDNMARMCNLVVIPFTELPESKDRRFLVVFEKADSPSKARLTKRAKRMEEKDSQRLARSRYELKMTEEYWHSINEEHQRTNDTLSSLNEELVSGNEELQSMNEELETAKEELQSTNEELNTVNDELQDRNHETALINDDLINLLNSVEIPILILDLNHRIRRFTPKARKIMNLLPSDIGRQFKDIRPNIVLDDLDQQIQDVIDTVEIKEIEVQDYNGRWYRLQIRPYKTLDNRIAGAVLSLIDINALRELVIETQEAKSDSDKANLAKDLFLATLSHELRTPLTSMIMQAQMLSRWPLDVDKVKKASFSIERAAKMQAQLIEDLLDVSRIVTGKLKMEFTKVNLNEVVQAAMDTVSGIAESKSVKIEASIDKTIRVSGDPVRLQQVVWNLLTNAIKFSSPGTTVTVNLQAADGHAQIQVIDRGIGISPEFLPNVFRRFTQAESTLTRTHGGLGLGLAIVRHLVEMHEGNVNVESSGKNKGATFTVTLPLIKTVDIKTRSQGVKKGATNSHTAKQKKTASLDGTRILLVEDDLGVREALAEMLTQAGAEVRSAASAPDAVKVLKKFEPDEMVLDIAMPGEDGYSLLRKIRKLEIVRGRRVPALALTALATEKDREKAYSAGFQMHLAKPVDIDCLTKALVELKGEGRPLQ